MYVKTSNQQVETFPYSIGLLRKDNPNTSFPKNPSDSLLAEWDVYPVTAGDKPTYASNEVAEQNAQPILTNGSWVLGWTVRTMTQAEVDAVADDVRAERNQKLNACDWTQLPDSPLDAATKTAYETYRQALRDVTSQAGFPTDVTWPVEP
jgi:hypothetical protein